MTTVRLVATSIIVIVGMTVLLASNSPAEASQAPSGFVSHRQLVDQAEQASNHAASLSGLTRQDAGSHVVASSLGARTSNTNPVYGFHPYWMNGAESSYNWSALSTLIFFKLEVTFDGYLNTSNSNYQGSLEHVQLAHANGVRVEYAFTSSDIGANNALLTSKTYYTRAADNLVAKMMADGADGLNIDLELLSGSNRDALTDFVKVLRQKLDAAKPGATLTIDIPAIDWTDAFDVATLSQYADGLIVMGYDYWGCWSDTAGPIAPLYSTSWRSNYSVWDSVQTYLGQMPASKLILGVPWYGGSWTTSGSSVPRSVTPSCSGGGDWLGPLLYSEAEGEAALHNKNWYPPSRVPYTTATAGQSFQTWYDDGQSLKDKYTVAQSQALGGVAIWALGYEDGDTMVWDGLAAYAQGVPDSLERLFGSNRYETAIEISKRLYPTADSAAGVVLATGYNWPDALGGATLAKKIGGPLLLSAGNDITPATATEIDRVLPAGGTVYLLGGQAALAPEVANDLTGLGFKVVRYGGATRYETAATIATALNGSPTSVFIGTGANFPDILSMASPAARRAEPILLTERDTLPQATRDFLDGSFGSALTTAYIAGGESVVSQSVAEQLAARGLGVVRLGGSDRYDTSRLIAEHFFVSPSSKPTGLALATGQTFADGLSGAVLAAANHLPVVLVQRDVLPLPVWDFLEDNASTLVDGFIFGGTAAVSRAVQNVAQTLIGQ